VGQHALNSETNYAAHCQLSEPLQCAPGDQVLCGKIRYWWRPQRRPKNWTTNEAVSRVQHGEPAWNEMREQLAALNSSLSGTRSKQRPARMSGLHMPWKNPPSFYQSSYSLPNPPHILRLQDAPACGLQERSTLEIKDSSLLWPGFGLFALLGAILIGREYLI
jgi:hypothetical protein